MKILEYLTISLFAIWCVSEIVINLISFRNRSRDLSEGPDRFSYFIVWFSTVAPIFIAYLIQKHLIFANGFGSFSHLFPLLGYLGCMVMVFGITIRLVAVATLKKQFTIKVSITVVSPKLANSTLKTVTSTAKTLIDRRLSLAESQESAQQAPNIRKHPGQLLR